MKDSLKIIVMIVALSLNACASDGQINAKRQNIEFGKNCPSHILKQFKKRVNVNGLLEVEMTFGSNYAKDLVYKIDWLDENGFILKDAINEEYRTLRIPTSQEIVLRKVAPNRLAKDIRIQIN
ncbi:YcfL family protein [Helicobacter sp.]|uniref:YcfL family protein n=1 Tax=Helicobacter sp. TaxID=218 RepID=UPI0019C6A155|nr:YcfL family protein [Helicobacter sp.]MBD5165400.1 YcfL family protein [Helicobacter sp.]